MKIITYEVTFAVEDDSLSASEVEEQIWSKKWKGISVINTVEGETSEIEFKPVVL